MAGVTSQTTRGELTLEQYLQTPETMLRHEVIDGIVVMSPAPTAWHQMIQGRLFFSVFEHVARSESGVVLAAPLDLFISRSPKLRVRQPDLLYLGRERMSREQLKKVRILEVVPDLAAEIVSPSEPGVRWLEKLRDYAAIQLPEIWRIDPEAESFEVLCLDETRYVPVGMFGKDDVLRSRVLPGLALAVGPIFA